ncbi:hypothetical protein GGG16DRAFT_113827 [Schizophyllum commune]
MHSKVALTVFAAIMTLSATATPNPVVNVVSDAELVRWLKTTDAELTFIGAPIAGFNAPEGLSARSAKGTTVVYCNRRTGNVCGGACTVYNGGPKCLDAPGTNCLSANHDVGFCNRSGCGHTCNTFSGCGERMDSNFCYTPGTASILVGNY